MDNYAKSGRNNDERNESPGINVHQGSGSYGQRDYDRGSIRVFEEKLAGEPYGDWLSDSRDAQKSVSEFIIRVAKEEGLFVDETALENLGERKSLPSGESVIYMNVATGLVYKVRDPFAKFHLKSGRAIEVLYDHIVHNILFPETRYQLIGISEVLGDVRFIFSQNFFFAKDIPTQKQIDDKLALMGLRPLDRYYYGNDIIAVTDVSASSDNVLLGENGELLFIDPIIKFRKPVAEVLDYLLNQQHDVNVDTRSDNTRSFWDRMKSLLGM